MLKAQYFVKRTLSQNLNVPDMQNKIALQVKILLLAAFFTFVFNKQFIGLNLLLFETAVLLIIAQKLKWKFESRLMQILFARTCISCLFSVINGASFAIAINIISAVVLVGYVYFPAAQSLVTAIINSASNVFTAQYNFYLNMVSAEFRYFNFRKIISVLKIGAIPIAIIGLFLLMYKLSNPVFEEKVNHAAFFLNDILIWFFERVEISTIGLFVLGTAISNFILLSSAGNVAEQYQLGKTDVLTSNVDAEQRSFVVKNELAAGVFLLLALNAMLLIVNVIDIKWVWLPFVWEGEYLKQFVHEGTHLLIVTILISVVIILYFFRGEINFYSKNKFLKVLSILWLAQNFILAMSVAMRNIRYIEHFALAYKRIGVIIFLIIVLIGITTVIMKVIKKKSPFYLFKINALSVYVVLIVASLFNWDTIIAKYNFANYTHSFVHYDFLSELPDKCLPYLDKSKEELIEIDKAQKNILAKEGYYMSAEEYSSIIEKRKARFIKEYEKRSFLSWNYAEYDAYNKLK